jgi:hypothetical protein
MPVYVDKFGFKIHRVPKLTKEKLVAINVAVANATAHACGPYSPCICALRKFKYVETPRNAFAPQRKGWMK